jgi:hypothetical protein
MMLDADDIEEIGGISEVMLCKISRDLNTETMKRGLYLRDREFPSDKRMSFLYKRYYLTVIFFHKLLMDYTIIGYSFIYAGKSSESMRKN